MAQLSDKMDEAEREFLEAFVKILHHLHTRATKAEAEVLRLREELSVRREQVEYMTGQLQTEPLTRA